jgi:hypothetical protein
MSRKKRKRNKKKNSLEDDKTPPSVRVPPLGESIFQLILAYVKTLMAYEMNLEDAEVDLWFGEDNDVMPDIRWAGLSQQEVTVVIATINKQIIEIKRHITEVRGVPQLTLTGTEYPFPDKGA